MIDQEVKVNGKMHTTTISYDVMHLNGYNRFRNSHDMIVDTFKTFVLYFSRLWSTIYLIFILIRFFDTIKIKALEYK